MDEHWKPMTTYCSMCIMSYDYVIKFEDYLNEGQGFLKQSNLSQYVLPEEVFKTHINTNRPEKLSR
jgi:hypothetical protein